MPVTASSKTSVGVPIKIYNRMGSTPKRIGGGREGGGGTGRQKRQQLIKRALPQAGVWAPNSAYCPSTEMLPVWALFQGNQPAQESSSPTLNLLVPGTHSSRVSVLLPPLNPLKSNKTNGSAAHASGRNSKIKACKSCVFRPTEVFLFRRSFVSCDSL